VDNRSKVFGIGFQKTGTTSLHHFLRRLGYSSIHWPHVVAGINYEKLCIPAVQDRRQVVGLLSPLFEGFDAFTDVPFPGLYRELFEIMPDSRFILVERDPDQWWESLSRHWRLTASRARRLDPYEYLVYNLYSSKELECVMQEDREMMKEIFQAHSDSVRSFFHSQGGRVLAVNLEDPEKGERISRFLGTAKHHRYPVITRRSSPRGAPSMGAWKR
jgi:hypothetical protein